jgi:4-carboxymuconolactone decarboxylase
LVLCRYFIVRSIRECQGATLRRSAALMRHSGRDAVCVATGGAFMDQEMFAKGLHIRREVLGAEYVDQAMAAADDFNRPLQELVTQYCWGEIWGRPGLDRKTRSLLNLAMLSALNRPHEVKIHVKGAIANGLSKDDIKEVFLQVMIYCGAPAAMDSFRVAKECFKELGI